jgi:outer membrane lipoprotein-sorting protein
LDGAKTIRLSFRQTFIWKLTGESNSLSGELVLSGENQFRLATSDQIVVSDGRTLWTYALDTKQVTIDKPSDSDETTLPRQLLFRFARDYETRSAGEDTIGYLRCPVLDLRSRTGSDYIPKVRIWIDPNEDVPRRIEQTDINGDMTRYDIVSIQTGVPVEATLFRFEIPAGADVVDMR